MKIYQLILIGLNTPNLKMLFLLSVQSACEANFGSIFHNRICCSLMLTPRSGPTTQKKNIKLPDSLSVYLIQDLNFDF